MQLYAAVRSMERTTSVLSPGGACIVGASAEKHFIAELLAVVDRKFSHVVIEQCFLDINRTTRVISMSGLLESLVFCFRYEEIRECDERKQ
jgi:hypothetical protein